jgi:hypothetical protein
MKYLPNLSNIVGGGAFSSAPVSDALDSYAVAVNEVNNSNFATNETNDDSLRQITNRRIHKGALSESFHSGVLTQGEPACWVAIGRGGVTKTGKYSLGPQENIYTVDGCSVRVATDRRCGIHVDGFVQVESIKVANQVYIAASVQTLEVLDINLTFKLMSAKPGGDDVVTHDTKTTSTRIVGSIITAAPLAVNDGYRATLEGQRGFTVHLSGYYGLNPLRNSGFASGAPSSSPVRSLARDFYIQLETSIPSAIIKSNTSSAGGQAALRLDVNGSDFNEAILYAHIKSLNRGLTARAFYVGSYRELGSQTTHPY